MVDQVLRGGALDFVEADECSRRCPRRVGGLHNSSEIEALTVGAVFERHGDRGAGHEGGGIGERAFVDVDVGARARELSGLALSRVLAVLGVEHQRTMGALWGRD